MSLDLGRWNPLSSTPEEYSFFSDGGIRLSRYNIVYFSLDGSAVAKAVVFKQFKEHISYYSEFMSSACCSELHEIEKKAQENAKKSSIARLNLK